MHHNNILFSFVGVASGVGDFCGQAAILERLGARHCEREEVRLVKEGRRGRALGASSAGLRGWGRTRAFLRAPVLGRF